MFYVAAFALVLGTGFAALPKPAAAYPFVFVRGALSLAFHDGRGPYVIVDGRKVYFQKVNGRQVVSFDGITYPVRDDYRYLFLGQ